MNAADVVSGLWQSDLEGLMYIITQVEDRFTWRVMHKNGDMETGNGRFLLPEFENALVPVEAEWRVYSAQQDVRVHSDKGYIKIVHGRACEIQWSRRERFFRDKAPAHRGWVKYG